MKTFQYYLQLSGLLVFIAGPSALFAQPESSWQLKGFVGVNQSTKATYLTLGGPGISLTRGHAEIALRLLPAIRFDHKSAFRGQPGGIIPVVGGGLQVRYKRYLLNAPLGYFARGEWELAAGLGFLLTKPKKKKTS